MNITEFLYYLQKKKIQVWLSEENQILIDYPEDSLDDNLIETIKKNKDDIIDILKLNKIYTPQIIPYIYHLSSVLKAPLSFAQQRLWFLYKYQGDESYVYNEHIFLYFTGNLNLFALGESINCIIRRHSIYRTLFCENDKGEPFQRVLPYDEKCCGKLVPEKTETATIENRLLRELNHCFDLSQETSVRIRLLEIVEENKYVLSIIQHHMATDGRSLKVFLEELTSSYNELSRGNKIPEKELELQYVDFAVWQNQYLTKDMLLPQLDYWKNKLADSDDLQLPTDKPRPSEQTYSGSYVDFGISSGLTGRLNRRSKETGTSLFMLMLSGFYILLSRYTGQYDITIGTPVANRHLPQIEDIIGFFVNTLALRANTENQTVKSFINQVKNSCLDAYENQDLPFEYLVDNLNITRDLSKTPIFQVMFGLQNATNDIELNFQDVNVETGQIHNSTAKFELSLDLMEKENSIHGRFEYCSDLFNRKTIEQMVCHYKNILSEMINHPDKLIREITLLTTEEYQKAVYDWNRTETLNPEAKTAIQLFEEQAAEKPENTAVIFEDQQLTYKKLQEKADLLASAILDRQVKPQSIIVFYLDRDITYLASMLAVWKSNCIFVPLNPLHPHKKNATILKQFEHSLLITSSKHYDKASKLTDKDKILVPDDLNSVAEVRADFPPADGEDIAYIIFTSGSTGTPKGAMVQHKGMLNHLLAKVADFGLSDKDRVAQTATQTFDVSVWQYMSALLAGGTTVVFSDEKAWEPEKLLRLIADEAITVFESVPSHMSVILDELEQHSGSYRLPCLKWFIMNGEGLPPEYCRRWFKLFPCIPMANVYGPTECSDDVTHYRFTSVEDCSGVYVPIGKPIRNTKLYVLDKYLQPVPVGVPGELYVSGVCVGKGYVNSDEKTKANFLENPFRTDDEKTANRNELLYKTGDLVRRLPDGNLEYLNRVDFQVKIRGQRIETGEIESQILKYEPVRNCVVTVYEDKKKKVKWLVAYYTLNKSGELEIREMKAFLADKLPEYMIPGIFIRMDSLPVTSAGKLDRKALPEPDINKIMTESYTAPSTEVEMILSNIWQEVLRLDKVGIYNNFFSLGGNSLNAIQIISRINRIFEIKCPIKILFENQNIILLANEIVKLQEKGRKKAVFIPVAERDKFLPLSFSQQRLWFLDRYQEGNSGNYNIAIAFRVKGEFNLKVFEDSINTLIERHESFRTVFKTDEKGDGFQEIKEFAKALRIKIETTPLSKSEIYEKLREEGMRGFDLSTDQLIRIRIFKIDDSEYIISIIQHHIISDGWSINIFLKELSLVYNFLLSGREMKLPKLDIQYADFAAWQREYFQKDVLQEQINYWKNHLVGFERLRLPTDKPRPSVQSFNGAILDFDVSHELTDKLKTLSEETNCTLYIVLLSAFYILLNRYTGQDDIVIGTPIANRQFQQVENLIGFFVNTLALRANVKGHSVSGLIREVRNDCLAAYEHQDLPFERLIEELGVEREQSYSPVFQVMFVLQNIFDDHELVLNGVDVNPVDVDYNVSKFDLTLGLVETHQGIRGEFEFNTDLFECSTIERMACHYQNILSEIVNYPEKPVAEVSFLSDLEYKQLLHEWNNTGAKYPVKKTIPMLFEEQVAKTPDRTAAVFEDNELTYSELNKRACQVAHYIRKQYKAKYYEDLKPDTLIGICFERSLEMIIGILGILKAGGAYLPLDPEYPENRMKYIVNDSKISFILTNNKFLSKPGLDKERCLTLDDNKNIDCCLTSNPECVINSTNLVYVIYTSGSTGLPKGVMIEHRSLVNRLLWMRKEYGFGGNDNVLQKTPYTFDVSVWELLLPLISGSRQVFAKPDGHKEPAYLAELIIGEKITKLHFVPSMLDVFLSSISIKTLTAVNHVLKHIFCSGEVLKKALALKCKSLLPKVQLHNLYGPTEASIDVTYHEFLTEEDYPSVPIGKPVNNVSLYVLDITLNPVPVGVYGELYIGGDCLARGYLNNAALTAERFIANPFVSEVEKAEDRNLRIYRSGDIVRRLSNGSLEFSGRNDNQVKINGLRIELGEIETVLLKYPCLEQAAVAINEKDDIRQLCAYYVAKEGNNVNIDDLKRFLAKQLPAYMVPSFCIKLDTLPLSINGKLDVKALPAPDIELTVSNNYVAPANEIEKTLSGIWCDVLKLDKVGVNNNFFDVGGDSLRTIKVQLEIKKRLKVDIKIIDLFTYPTIGMLTEYISGACAEKETFPLFHVAEKSDIAREDIAIIGYSGAFSGCSDIEEYWEKISNGKDCISHLNRAECLKLGITEQLLNDKDYVASCGLIDGVDEFDADFWGITPREAELMDPQIRHFIQHSWIALEKSGYINERDNLSIGVFAGAGSNLYFMSNIATNKNENLFEANLLANKDFLATKTAYLLNLKGPVLNLNTACSTSLVTVVEACNQLILRKCDLALAGGVTLQLPEDFGYIYHEGIILSPDGHCRVFDKNAKGTVSGSGVGSVVLKRISDARRDGDNIIAIIKGYAVNNDGNRKVGYTAPSVQGQKECIIEAQHSAGLFSDEISYIECHGTATELGDPIEIEALNKAFVENSSGKRRDKCILGGVKANVGHTDAAAGVAGLIKVCKMLENRTILPQIYFEEANPHFSLSETSFEIVKEKQEWKTGNNMPLRAGVSAFGIGGTNAHVILEEAPVVQNNRYNESRLPLICLSAKTAESLSRAKVSLLDYLRKNQDENIDDIAYTLQVCRKSFPYKSYIVCKNIEEVMGKLESNATDNLNFVNGQKYKKICFMFSGQGAQYLNMGKDLYLSNKVFRDSFNECNRILASCAELNLKEILYPETLAQSGKNQSIIHNTRYTQLILFAVEYSLAKLWNSAGVYASCMIGHSIGEYTAACLSGVFTLEEALKVINARASLMSKMDPGTMMTVGLKYEEVKGLLSDSISFAAVNTENSCVLSGPSKEIIGLKKMLESKEIFCSIVKTSHAFHSQMMTPMLNDFRKVFNNINLKSPVIPFISNITGTWIKEHEATDPEYWVKHVRNTVLFSKGIAAVLEDEDVILIEAGPGKTLSSFAKHHMKNKITDRVLTSLPDEKANQDAESFFFNSFGKLWLAGYDIDFNKLYQSEKRKILPLPAYSFDKKRYWIHANTDSLNPVKRELSKLPVKDLFYTPVWKKIGLPGKKTVFRRHNCLIFSDSNGIGVQIKNVLSEHNNVYLVNEGNIFEYNEGEKTYTISSASADDYIRLFDSLKRQNIRVNNVYHLWLCNEIRQKNNITEESLEHCMDTGFYSLLYCVKELTKNDISDDLLFTIAAGGLFSITGDELLYPEKNTITGMLKCIQDEYPDIKCHCIDIDPKEKSTSKTIAGNIIRESLYGFSTGQTVAYRKLNRWIEDYEKIELAKTGENCTDIVKKKGKYLITGGLGGIGYTLADYIAGKFKADLILLFRTELPERNRWEEYLKKNVNKQACSSIQRILELEKHGINVQIINADVSNKDQMIHVADSLKGNNEKIDGIIHAAGVPAGQVLVKKTKEYVNRIFAPKIAGTIILNELFEYDFMFLCSSLTAVRGGFGQADYAAANAFLDAFAVKESLNNGSKIFSCNWDLWQGAGMGLNFDDLPNEVLRDIRAIELKYAITPCEGQEIFDTVINNDLPRITAGPIFYENRETEIKQYLKKQRNNVKNVYTRPVLPTEYEAPSSSQEQKIVDIWQDILGISNIGIHDDFFDLGGDSLVAVSLISKLKQSLGIQVNVAWLYENPTVYKQNVNIIEKKGRYRPVIVYNKKGTSPSLFFIHPGTGGAEVYFELAKMLDKNIPFYGVESHNLYSDQKMIDSIESLAEKYIEAITQVNPSGPYCLGGWSLGGIIAYEMARQFSLKGVNVNTVFMLDSNLVTKEERELYESLSAFYQNRLKKNVKNLKDRGRDYWERLKTVQALEDKMVYSYSCPEYEKSRVVLFKALFMEKKSIDVSAWEEEILEKIYSIKKAKKANGWENIAGDLEITDMHCCHQTIMNKKNLRIISEYINNIMIN